MPKRCPDLFRDRIHVSMIGYSPPTLPSRIWLLNMEGAIGVMRRVANTRLAVKRRVAYPADTNTSPDYGGGSWGYAPGS